MKVLVSEKLSEHKYKTPEGYLICTDAILARTGKQTYTKDEVFGDGDSTEIDIDRPYDQVMNEKTIASFENKPVTFDHPDEDVNVGNYKDYAIGYVRDVHQGKTDKGEEVIMGNLVITDQEAINAIEQGDHTDLSCGYDCDIKDDGNGNYSQTNIRGNHLALCEQGRAGIAHIVDSKAKDAATSYCEYKFEYDTYYHDLKTREEGFEHHVKVGNGRNVYEAAMNAGLDEDDEIVRVYKEGKLLKSFTSRHVGEWHMRGNMKALKNIVEDSKEMTMSDAIKMLNIVDAYKKVKRRLTSHDSIDDAKVVNEDDLKYIASAKKILKKGNSKQQFVVKNINSSYDYAEGFASDDGGKTWQTAKTRLVKRNTDNSRYQSERRFGSGFVEIPFSHIVYCYTNNLSTIPNDTIDHVDGNHMNDRPSNLEAVSSAENTKRKNIMYKRMNATHDSKQTTSKDASKDKWVIKNTGLAYEIWNQGEMIKRFPAKKLAIEWIHSRFPTDEITEDSTKDGRVRDEYLGMVYINGRPMYVIHKKEPGIPEFWGITPSKWSDNPRKKFKSKKELDDYLTSVNAVSN